jgi:N-acetylneuraminic acid mutarotase
MGGGDSMRVIELAEQSYVRLNNVTTGMNQHGFEACNGKLYAAGGDSGKKFYEYSLTTHAWTAKADLPFAEANRQSAILRAVGTKLYFIGGYNAALHTYYDSVYEYDTAGADSWTEKTAMPTAREDMGSAVVDGLIYVFGGITSPEPTVTNVMEVYDPAQDTWDETKADLPVAKLLGDFGCACNGKIYAIGATNTMTGYPNLTPVLTVYEYNPGTDQWATKTAMPTGASRCYKECESIGNYIYVVAGALAAYGTPTDVIYRYDTVGDSWTQLFNAPYSASGSALAVLSDKIYMCGGHLNHQELYRFNF